MNKISFEDIPDKLMGCMRHTEQYINGLSVIEKPFTQLLRYHVSVINQCPYCIDMHFQDAIAAGESEQRLYSLPVWRETDFYTETEQALLAWAESVTTLVDSAELRQQAFTSLSQYFSKQDIANLTLMLVQINSWNRLAKSFGFAAGSYQLGEHDG